MRRRDPSKEHILRWVAKATVTAELVRILPVEAGGAGSAPDLVQSSSRGAYSQWRLTTQCAPRPKKGVHASHSG